MAKTRRMLGPRFTVGQTVTIRDCITTIDIGKIGTVISIQANQHSRTLDKYVIQFPTGIQKTFWDVQLKGVADEHA
jgi:hypothetical protein